MDKELNTISKAEDKYSAYYWTKVADYNKSADKIFDEVISDIYNLIEDASNRGLHFSEIELYSVTYRRAEFHPGTEKGDNLKKQTLSRVKTFLEEKGFYCRKNGIRLRIEWNAYEE